MDTSLPTGRSGRLAALGITFIILGFLWLAVATPLIGLYESGEDKAERQSALASHMAALAEELPALRSEAAGASGRDRPTQITLAGSSDAVAAAALQSDLQEMATGTGANLSSIENVPAETVGAYRRIGLKLSFDASWTVLVNLLAAVDRANPPMLIDNLEIHASPIRQANQPVMLDVGMTVYALRSAAGEREPS